MCPDEVRPSPDVAVFFLFFFDESIGCVIFGTALHLLCRFGTIQDTGAMEGFRGGEREEGGIFFIVQYAVHKSLAHQILQFRLILFCC